MAFAPRIIAFEDVLERERDFFSAVLCSPDDRPRYALVGVRRGRISSTLDRWVQRSYRESPLAERFQETCHHLAVAPAVPRSTWRRSAEHISLAGTSRRALESVLRGEPAYRSLGGSFPYANRAHDDARPRFRSIDTSDTACCTADPENRSDKAE